MAHASCTWWCWSWSGTTLQMCWLGSRMGGCQPHKMDGSSCSLTVEGWLTVDGWQQLILTQPCLHHWQEVLVHLHTKMNC
jgi:hypothetical protein